MKKNLETELNFVKQTVSRMIGEDSFPETVEPELLREAVRAYPMRGGKRLRPALLLWSCAAAGGKIETALPAAAAVEIYHNWTLVHDDIIDRDELRRGEPTCHVVLADGAGKKLKQGPERAALYGTDMAILAGDIQQAWAVDMMLRTSVSAETRLACVRRMQQFLNRTLISGEALDVEFEFRPEYPDRSEIRKMIAGKTGALLAYCTETGAMIGLDTPETDHPVVRALSLFAAKVGHAFQLQDDLLGLYGDEKSFGKPLCSDFREKKPTILYSEAVARLNGTDLDKLRSMTGLEHYGRTEIIFLRDLLDRCGAHAAVSAEMIASTESAMTELYRIPASPWRDLLENLARKLCSRNV